MDCSDENLTTIYRRYCERPEDPEIARFLLSWKKTVRTVHDPIVINDDFSSCHFFIVITHEGKALGKVSLQVKMKPTGRDAPAHRVVDFDKQRFVDEIHRMLVSYGNPPVRAATISLVDNILRDFARKLEERGVEFDPTLFDA